MYFLNNFVDLNDQKNAVKFSWRTDYNLIDVNTYKSWKLYFKKVEFKEDENLPFFSLKTFETYSFEKKETDIIVQQRTPILFMVNVYSSNVVQKKTRIYQSIPEALGNLWGLLGLFTIFGLILTEPMFKLELIHSIFKERRFYNEVKFTDLNSYLPGIIPRRKLVCKSKTPPGSLKEDLRNENYVQSPIQPPASPSRVQKSKKTRTSEPENICFDFHHYTDIPGGSSERRENSSESSILSEGPHRQTQKEKIDFPTPKLKRQYLDFLELKGLKVERGGWGSQVSINEMRGSADHNKISNENSATPNEKGLKKVESPKEASSLKANCSENLEMQKKKTKNRNNFFSKLKFIPGKTAASENASKNSLGLNFFPFTLFEYMKLKIKEILRFELSSREKTFKKVLKTHARELNISVLLQRVFILEKKIETILSIQESMEHFRAAAKFSVFDILND